MWISVAVRKTPVGFHELWSMFEPDFSGSARTALPAPVLRAWSADLPRGAVRPQHFLPKPQRRQNEGAGQRTEKFLCWGSGLAICHEVRPPKPSPLLHKELAGGKTSVPAPPGLYPACWLLHFKICGLRVDARWKRHHFWGKTPDLVGHPFPWVSRQFSGCSWDCWAC